MITPSPHAQRKHVLYIDADASFVWVLKRFFENMGHRITAFAGTAEALAAIERAPDAFNVVVTDYRLPGITGLEMAQAIRARHPSVPCIVVSDFVTRAMTVAAADAGIRDFHEKPFLVRQLVQLVERAAN